jgi:lycopene cyclase domain-containing protein
VEYLLVLFTLLIVSNLLKYKFNIHLYKTRRERFWIPILFVLVGTIMDSFAVYRGYWYFDIKQLTGIVIGFLPIEEYLFFIIFPYFLLIIYKVFKKEI